MPVIKPRTTVNNKNEFNVEIERRDQGTFVADMSMFPKPLLREAEEGEMSYIKK